MESEKSSVAITVIITVHNSEKFLRACLDSVISQTFSDIEILCIDGGSKDQSPQILEEYAQKDKRIQIVNDANTSYGHKVNKGICLARGEYISVLESDDMYLPNMLENLYVIAKKYKPDYVNADYLEFRMIDGRRYETAVRMYQALDYNRCIESSKHPENMRQILRYWTGIFKKEFLIKKDIKMNESAGASFQDMSFRFLTSALADSCFHLDMPVYLYRVDNEDSSVHNPEKAVVIADEYDFLRAELERRQIENGDIWRHFYTWKYNDFYGNLIRFGGEARRALYERGYRELDRDRKYLEEHSGKKYSQVLADLLEKSKEAIRKDIEEKYEYYIKKNIEREQFYRKVKDNKIVIFGCGQYGKSVLDTLYSEKNQICCYTDNNQELWYTSQGGYQIIPPEEAVKHYKDALYIVANKLYSNEIIDQLKMMGVWKIQQWLK